MSWRGEKSLGAFVKLGTINQLPFLQKMPTGFSQK